MDARKKYLKMLAVELQDLQEDIEVVIESSQRRLEDAEISRYVVLGIANVSTIIEAVNPADYDDLDSMVADLDRRFAEKLKERGFPAGVHQLIRRKLNKLADYVRCEP